MSKQKNYQCTMCKVTTLDDTTYESHIQGAKHQAAVQNEKRLKCKVYITGFPKHITHEQLKNFFGNYGNLNEFYLEPNNRFCIVRFESEMSVQNVLNTDVYYQGYKLVIRPARPRKVNTEIVCSPLTEVSTTDILTAISKCLTFSDQLATLLNMLRPSEKEKQNHLLLISDLEHTLSSRFANCTAWPFGSTVNGLNFASSDVDVYIDVPTPPFVIEEALRCVAYTKLARSILEKSPLFTQIIAILTAKTPIVKCVHVATGTKCDFNFKNKLGTQNSQLIKHLLSVDDNLKQLLIVVKFWAKVHNLTGQGRLSNYALTLLVIFYLQCEGILPPITDLQTSENEDIIDGWDCGFNQKNLVFLKSKKIETVYNLLWNFFNFYSKFDFTPKVIAPLSGQAHLKSDFIDRTTLPIIFYRYITSTKEVLNVKTPMCVQDPFELNHNITAGINDKKLIDFQQLCQNCAKIDFNENDNYLNKLLDKQTLPAVVTTKASSSDNSSCTFQISMDSVLPFCDPNAEQEFRQNWFKDVKKFSVIILEKVFLFEMNEIDDIISPKKPKLDLQPTTIDIFKWHVIGRRDVWNARKTIAKTLKNLPDENTNIIEREIKITEHISNVLLGQIPATERLLEFNLTLSTKINPTEVEFLLESTSSKKHFKQMSNYISSKLPYWFQKYTKANYLNKLNCIQEKLHNSDEIRTIK